eukprot:9453549-Pyramimonas_sp.AAC.1
MQESSDSAHSPLSNPAIPLAHYITALAARSLGRRVGVRNTGLLLLQASDRTAAPIIRHFREVPPCVLGR